MIERCVVVQRQADGYGLTVTGDHPVYVYTVRQEGAAYCAGVRKGDRIIKVNGMPVTSSNHLEVVRMISGGQNVALTLLGKPPEPLEVKPEAEYLKADSFRDLKNCEHLKMQKSVFAVQANNNEERTFNRKEMIHRMLEDEKKNIEDLRFSNENKEKLEQALERVEKLQSQLNLRSVGSDSHWLNRRISSNQDLFGVDVLENEDEKMPPLDSTAPFTNIVELKSRPAHLAIFFDHLIQNGNPSSLFFYLITDAYQTSQATPKDLRRWAFEIFSTFLVPNGPMCLFNSDQSIIQPIDKMLNVTAKSVSDSEGESLRKVFTGARQRALADVTEQLTEFRQKRETGFGSDSNQLHTLTRSDSSMELRLAESKLMNQLETVLVAANGDYDACEPKTQAIISSLATLIKVKGHVFSYNPVNVVHYCYQCRNAIWGIQAFGYFCLNCDVVLHKNCTAQLADACYPASQKTRGKNKRPALKSSVATANLAEETEVPGASNEKQRQATGHKEQNVKSTSSDSGIGVDMHEKHVARSQSMRSRLSQMTSTTLSEDVLRSVPRGRSTYSWGAGAADVLLPADELTDLVSTLPSAATAAQRARNRSVESGGNRIPSDLHSNSGASSASHDEDIRRIMAAAAGEEDSDLEVETEVPSLESILGWEVVRHLKPKEKKRQEVINELFHTERTHVRNLKIICKLFYKPMQIKNAIKQDLIDIIFANIEEILEIHQEMFHKMREERYKWRADVSLNGLHGEIAALMEEMFEGAAGERLREATSTFCKNQQHALDILRSRYKSTDKDQLARFLTEVENHPLCRKLQLKDMLPMEMQRLVKYPMLLETVAKYTQEDSAEQERLLGVVAAAKRILSAVNTAKRNAENQRRLKELQMRMDTTPFDKENNGSDYFSLDLTKFHLVHDGPLTVRFNRGKMVELHVILLENVLILLTRLTDGSKLLLKPLETGKEKFQPIFNLASLMVKEKANDKRALFLVQNQPTDSKGTLGGAQMFELIAATTTERKTWLKLMSDQIEYVKKLPTQGIEPFRFELGITGESDGLEKVQVLTHPRLVNANEITILQPTVLEHAQPVLTPSERLKRNDELILKAILDKQTILAQYLPGDNSDHLEQLEKLVELLGSLSVGDLKQRDPKELAMSAIVHGNRLLDSINRGITVQKSSEDGESERIVLEDADRHLPSVPCYRLLAIAAPLMNHLKALMQVVQSQQAELANVRQQLSRYKDIAESAACDRSVSEETLTEGASNLEALSQKLLAANNNRAAPSIPPCPPPPL